MSPRIYEFYRSAWVRIGCVVNFTPSQSDRQFILPSVGAHPFRPYAVSVSTSVWRRLPGGGESGFDTLFVWDDEDEEDDA